MPANSSKSLHLCSLLSRQTKQITKGVTKTCCKRLGRLTDVRNTRTALIQAAKIEKSYLTKEPPELQLAPTANFMAILDGQPRVYTPLPKPGATEDWSLYEFLGLSQMQTLEEMDTVTFWPRFEI